MRCAWLVLMAAVAACSDPAGPSGPTITSTAERKEIPLYVNRQIDLLFVVDTSPAMTPHLARVAENLPRYMHELETIEGGLPDVHIGVVTADLGAPAAGCTATGQDGAVQPTASVTGAFIRDRPTLDGPRERNYTGALANVFTQLASRGDQGCAVQQPLEAAKRALSGIPANAGFLRDDAYLAIVHHRDRRAERRRRAVRAALQGPEARSREGDGVGGDQPERPGRCVVRRAAGTPPPRAPRVVPEPLHRGVDLRGGLHRRTDGITGFTGIGEIEPKLVVAAGWKGGGLAHVHELHLRTGVCLFAG